MKILKYDFHLKILSASEIGQSSPEVFGRRIDLPEHGRDVSHGEDGRAQAKIQAQVKNKHICSKNDTLCT